MSKLSFISSLCETLCQPYVNPMSTPCQAHVKPMSTLCQPHVKPMLTPCQAIFSEKRRKGRFLLKKVHLLCCFLVKKKEMNDF